ncbi:bifunctional riboflavin kinase/FAD synthetase [Mesobacillus zeae]|uniref:Riboflavin biosynthesis protein n=1 Tax=Mesobacillus zeae TaxID=1917180 RepID=A0A398BE14_9BACI|nr:bifunctional riboflavin kinase/FAD synthetase [Mesobacillus zeae]RID88037.1 bifunctional riboflavin kinase/FAD synthetase [Mesobacillus zeae]
MEYIKLQHPHSYKNDDFPPIAMALGYFDGVHLGHQQVIAEAKRTADSAGMKSAVMTFDPHPSVVLGKSIQHVEYITPIEDKIQYIRGMGVDYLFVVHFTQEFSNLLPQEFIDQYVIDLNVRTVVAGFDYTYGKMGKGTMETIPFHSRGMFDYAVVPKLASSGEKISSTLIRSCLREGRMEELPSLLGRPYSTSGTVIHGDKRGRTIGFPTANVNIEEYIIPPTGVYAVRINVKGDWHFGVCNIGYRPTFKENREPKPSIEVHIFNFEEEIYDEYVKVEWHARLRGEKKFSGIDELVGQIAKDRQEALVYFENYHG